RNYGVLSGPSHAEEVAKGLPAGVVMAGNEKLCNDVVSAMHQNNFRIYTSHDIVGVEMGGALKNVVAIAAGMCDGMSLGDNIKATLVTRGLAEIRRLGRALGAEDQSFAGLAGIGDLLTTCYSPFGRNRSLGERIGTGEQAKEILASSAMVAEGAWTSQAAVSLAAQLSVDLPVAEQVTAVLWQGKPLQDAMEDLLSRESKDENL
ncbi:MAG: NAD(P)H-dependent glycerol-3-phosphate dehydrogenase, partial [Planctomycetes bacterium]|nr:NAD(P)H-dependent glycerol-3-phosphate dehydrogenase [Planctomycetota bacterium]